MDPICFLVGGVLRAILPLGEFTLEWRHSVQKTRWIEHYRTDGAMLVLDTASVPRSQAPAWGGRRSRFATTASSCHRVRAAS
jgi:hypothetical protein